MQIILLSGGSGKRLWPLSNNTRSKQFLKLLASPIQIRESMLQRVTRQLRESGIGAQITVATSASQKDVIVNQLGAEISIVTEPERRDTFPAIALASSYLALEKGCSSDETVVVMPCDPYTELRYFETILKMTEVLESGIAELVLMGVKPSYPSSKYGYIVPSNPDNDSEVYSVQQFIEKPNEIAAQTLITKGAYWNGGVFAFKLGYLIKIVRQYLEPKSFSYVYSNYSIFPKISFDYEVVEKAKSLAVVSFSGKWKDLGTWNTLSEELSDNAIGNVLLDESTNTHVINELEMPIMCIGTENLIVAASPDGILISQKDKSEKIKLYADHLQHRPMYEERLWGEYKVIDEINFDDGYKALTKQILIRSGRNISYQIHRHRDEVWTVVDGKGMVVIDGVVSEVSRGTTLHIGKGTKHAIRAITDLRIIEVQSGDLLIEEDIERIAWDWDFRN